MGNPTARMLLILLISSWAILAVRGYYDEGDERRWSYGEEEEYGGGGKRGMFMLEKARVVIRGEGGVVKVVKGYEWKGWPSTMHLAFIDMEPNSLFLPQYLDSHLVLFVRRGELKVGMIYKDDFVERNLTMGDIYAIPAGSAFYLANTGRGQRLQIICSIDTSESIGQEPFQSFFIGGGSFPRSVLSGFDTYTLTTALNVTEDLLSDIMERQTRGPLITINDTGFEGGDVEKRMSSIMRLKAEKIRSLKPIIDDEEDEDEDEEGKTMSSASETKKEESKTWTWRKMLNSIFGLEEEIKNIVENKGGTVRLPDAYNLYDRNPDFRNLYGWSVAIDKHDYKPLKTSGIGVYLVNLTAGSMLAPHVNPTATEYGVILGGTGRIEVVFPNGSAAMNVEVSEGDTFFIPRYFPFCQIAGRSGAFEFFGFTTSARRNQPQFLAGGNSIFNKMIGPELAAALDTREELLSRIFSAQNESVMLPSWPAVEREGEQEERGTEEGERAAEEEEDEEWSGEEREEEEAKGGRGGEDEPILIKKVAGAKD